MLTAKSLFKQYINILRKERILLHSEKKNISVFSNQLFLIICLILVVTFGVLVFSALPFFHKKYIFIYGFSFLLFTSLSFWLWQNIRKSRTSYLAPVYIFAIYLYSFGMYISVNSGAGGISHAATTVICFQIIFPLLIFDKPIRVNFMLILAYFIHTFLAFKFKQRSDFLLDTFNGATFTVMGFVIGEYERYIKLANFEKDRILSWQKDTDMLTNLPNRRMLFERLTDIQEKNGKLAGLFMIDIDHFKIFNDTFGHQQGDDCLKQLGKCFLEFGNENNFEFYRYGGEEFCALSTTDTYEELRDHAEKLLKKVESLQIPFEFNQQKVVTISLGFAPHYYTQSYEKTVKQADDALYNAKRAGRNCIFGSK